MHVENGEVSVVKLAIDASVCLSELATGPGCDLPDNILLDFENLVGKQELILDRSQNEIKKISRIQLSEKQEAATLQPE